ncbi:MAG: endonuclease [Marinilabiliaceae bacterium]|nr:endonuclease [Marinilabiliaceae bacterium]
MMVTVLILSLLFYTANGQINTDDQPLNIMFYNVENLFDCEDDSLTRDEEFMPDGDKHWTSYRMYQKVKGISKVILASNEWNPPSIIGMCEIENAAVLKKLIYTAGLNHLDYRFVHFDGADRRGVDVAILYRTSQFKCLKSKSICVSDTTIKLWTRDVLYVNGVIPSGDTLHVMVCHWPSKRGGALQSEHKRVHVAKQISMQIDTILMEQPHANIVVMGDFNAELESESLQSLLKAERSVLNCLLDTDRLWGKIIAGSHKYQGHWSLIDHIFVSHGLVQSVKDLHFGIVELPFLLEDDLTYSGVKPKRTYVGPRYLGGVSDHLPVMLKITLKKEGSRNDSPYNP